MAGKFKDFGSPVDVTQAQPISFSIYGQKFFAIPVVQGVVLLDIIGNSASDDVSVSSATVINFFKDVLEDESWKRFDTLLHSKETIVQMEKLGEIVGWLIEQYSSNDGKSRPEEPRED